MSGTRRLGWAVACGLAALVAAGAACKRGAAAPARTLTLARKALQVKLEPSALPPQPFEPAPEAIFRNVKYPASAGELRAYLTPDPGDGQRQPAIVWITGGDCNSLGDVWSEAPAANDQTAAAYRRAGVVMLFPSLRGGNDNPGRREGFLGEVDDVVAAHAYLSKIPYVDPRRIYLGGHSTGGTLALLVAESFDGYAGVFSFGPVADVRGYGKRSRFLPFDVSDQGQSEARSPGYWLAGIRSPTWIIEGAAGSNNLESLRAMRQERHPREVTFAEIPGADHFATLAPLNALIAGKIAGARADRPLTLTETELQAAFSSGR